MESWRPFIYRLALALIYASIFPISNLLGGGVMAFGISISIPFLPIGWVVGMFFVQAFGSENAYLPGAFFAILIQSLGCIYWLAGTRKKEINT